MQRLFTRKGVVEVSKAQGKATISDIELLEATLEANAEEITDSGETFEILSDPNDTVSVRKAVEAAGYDYESAEVRFVPSFTSPISDVDAAQKLFKLLDALEDCDDVQEVYSNEDVPDEVSAQLEAED